MVMWPPQASSQNLPVFCSLAPAQRFVFYCSHHRPAPPFWNPTLYLLFLLWALPSLSPPPSPPGRLSGVIQPSSPTAGNISHSVCLHAVKKIVLRMPIETRFKNAFQLGLCTMRFGKHVHHEWIDIKVSKSHVWNHTGSQPFCLKLPN